MHIHCYALRSYALRSYAIRSYAIDPCGGASETDVKPIAIKLNKIQITIFKVKCYEFNVPITSTNTFYVTLNTLNLVIFIKVSL